MVLMTALLLMAGQAAQPVAEPKPAEPKKICRRETSTSSRLDVKRVCRTRPEWDAIERAQVRDFQRQNDLGRGGSGSR